MSSAATQNITALHTTSRITQKADCGTQARVHAKKKTQLKRKKENASCRPVVFGSAFRSGAQRPKKTYERCARTPARTL